MRGRFSLILFGFIFVCGVAGAAQQRSNSQIEKDIKAAGEKHPDWWDAVELSYPKTLDLSWPEPEDGWNVSKNLGHYVTDKLSLDEEGWKNGIKLMDEVVFRNPGDRKVEKKAWKQTGLFYAYLKDWERAAYFFDKSGDCEVYLAECWLRMGGRGTASFYASKARRDDTPDARLVKLFSEIGMLDKALTIAESVVNEGNPSSAYLQAGDACRRAGKYDKAAEYYQKVQDLDDGGRNLVDNKRQARVSLEALEQLAKIDPNALADGEYKGESTGYNGKVEVKVTVERKKITAVEVGKSSESRDFGAAREMPEKIAEKGWLIGVDSVSGATATSRAIINATALALAKGFEAGTADDLSKKQPRDGLYNGEAKGYRSTVKVQVRISARKILSVKVIEHNEARPRTAIMEMPRRIALARDTKGVDVVTGATVTSNAILAAVEAAVEYAKTK